VIGPEELAKLHSLMDEAFTYKVNDIVQAKALGDFAEKPSGYGTATNSREKPSSWYHIAFSGQSNYRYQIIERWLQQCHGGIQKHYNLRLIDSKGLLDTGIRQVTEDEVSLSAPYREFGSTSKKDLQKFVDSLPEDGPDVE
jgi:hypothetical protein